MRISEMEVLSPKSLDECLELLDSEQREVRVIAGGTDAVVRMKDGKWRPQVWINVKKLKELSDVYEDADGIHIGPLVTHTRILQSQLLQEKANVLVQAAEAVGATQIRNMGTLGGNIATASPAGDTIPALYVLDAEIELTSVRGRRRVPVHKFFLGPGKTEMSSNELITDVVIRPQQPTELTIFEKLGPRKAQAISIVNVAIALQMVPGSMQCSSAWIAFGAVGPTIIRGKKCESVLSCAKLDDDLIENVAQLAWKEVLPISDIRASAEYRRDMACALLQRGLYRLRERWNHR